MKDRFKIEPGEATDTEELSENRSGNIDRKKILYVKLEDVSPDTRILI